MFDFNVNYLKVGVGIALSYLTVRYVASKIKIPNLSTRVVLITGCDTGFGNMTAHRLSEQLGVTVIAGCLTQNAVVELGKVKGIIPVLLDVTSDASIAASIDTIKTHAPNGLWAVINNAGLLRGGIFEGQSVDDFRLQMNVNMIGMAAVTKAVFPLIRKCQGRIINIASVAGRFATPNTVYYNSTKFAVEGFSDALRREVAVWGVKVIIIEPGVMKTPLWNVPMCTEEFERGWNSLTSEQQTVYGREYFEIGRKNATKLINSLAGNPETVVSALVEATTSRFPKIRYTVGFDANLVFVPLSYLPTCIADKLWDLIAMAPLPAAIKSRK